MVYISRTSASTSSRMVVTAGAGTGMDSMNAAVLEADCIM